MASGWKSTGAEGVGYRPGVHDLEHLTLVQVDVDCEPFDRPSPPVLDAVPILAVCRGETAVAFLWYSEVAQSRPGTPPWRGR